MRDPLRITRPRSIARPSTNEREAKFVEAARSYEPSLTKVAVVDIVKEGRDYCRAVSDGNGGDWAFMSGNRKTAASSLRANAIISSARQYLCPSG